MTLLCFLVIALIFLNSPFLQKALGAIIWIERAPSHVGPPPPESVYRTFSLP
jgi:hypothetical protein